MSAAVIAFPGCAVPLSEPAVEHWQGNMLLHAVRMVTSGKRIDRDAYYGRLCHRYQLHDLRDLPAREFVPLLREMQGEWWEVIGE